MKEQLATRLDPPLRQRLRVYAAVSGRQVTEVVSAALDGYLPSLAEIVQAAASRPGEAARELACRAGDANVARPERAAAAPVIEAPGPRNRINPLGEDQTR